MLVVPGRREPGQAGVPPRMRRTAVAGSGRRLRSRPTADAGSGTVWVLTGCVLAWVAALAVICVAGVRTDRHRAASAADLAALAAARHAVDRPDRVCAMARRTAADNGARLTSCTVAGLEVTVEVVLPARTWPATVTARAAAGPGSGAPHPRPPPAIDIRRAMAWTRQAVCHAAADP
ncbi:Rv3654c family TadE-like protein [Nocardiopsis trehalosi]|uniref:Rv3654c family TadE-like protein n=1 Tax=Nocardiopsis trehalosi TaxID=109329 RepID=UPI0034E261D5